MKKIMGLLGMMIAGTAFSQDLAGLWKEVETAREKDQPKTAAVVLEKIYAQAVADRKWDDALSAVAEQAILEGQVAEGEAAAYGPILKLEAAKGRVPDTLRPLLDALLATWTVSYFDENRWRFSQRTAAVDADEGNDLAAWSLPRILREVDARFAAALADPEALANHAANDFSRSFPAGSVSDSYRPTLYDLIVFRAIGAYGMAERRLSHSTEKFELDPSMPLLADADAFLAWVDKNCGPDLTRCGDHPTKKALVLSATILRFHRRRGDRLAWADADFNRLTLAKDLLAADCDETQVAPLFDAALTQFVETWKDNEVSLRAIALQAERLHEQKASVEAKALAERGIDAFPKAPAAKACLSVVRRVLARELQISGESVWAAHRSELRPAGTIEVRSRNLKQLWFRLYPVDAGQDDDEFPALRIMDDDEKRAAFLARPATAVWTCSLPDKGDYREVATHLPVEVSVPSGGYLVVASGREDFGDADNALHALAVQVSDLAVVVDDLGGRQSARVYDAETGVPRAGCKVGVRLLDRRKGKASTTNLVTDAVGMALLPAVRNQPMTLTIADGDQRLVHPVGTFWGYADREREQRQILLLTDRAIYRPGQTVHYKGIYYVCDPANGRYSVRPDAVHTLVFRDPNGKEIASRKQPANAFGSFAGTFAIPTDRGTGQMTLQMDEGSVSFQVEEYKRPKFEVVLDKPKEALKLDAPATLTGLATTYSGLPVAGAEVKWSVSRAARFPWWCWWRSDGGDTQIAQGKTRTDADGRFSVMFDALPDRAVKPADEPVFTFELSAEVVDATGETRSGETAVAIGYTAVEVEVEAPTWFAAGRDQNVTVNLRTLSGEPVAAKGSMTIHALRQPEKPFRGPVAEYDPFGGQSDRSSREDDPLAWAADHLVGEAEFTTDATGKIALPVKLEPGLYRIDIETRDRFGQPAHGKAIARVFDPAAPRWPVREPATLVVANKTVEVGDICRIVWGSGYAEARGLVEIVADGKVLSRFWSQPGATQLAVEWPVTEALRGGFQIRSVLVRENRMHTESLQIDVPWSDRKLSLAWTHLTSKLEPGTKESWRLSVKDADGRPAAAEVVAAMYDAALDAFAKQGWQSFQGFRSDGSSWNFGFANGQARCNTHEDWSSDDDDWTWSYRDWADQLMPVMRGHRMRAFGGMVPVMKMARVTPAAMPMEAMPMAADACAMAEIQPCDAGVRKSAETAPEAPPLRRNLRETAFFLPQLATDAAGEVAIDFTVPDALTGWRVMAFAHDVRLASGFAEARVVTQRKLMAEPNLPRFLREGDTIELPVKLTNTSDVRQKGVVTLGLVDGRTGASLDKAFGARRFEQPFELEPGKTVVASWRVTVPDNGAGIVQYKVLAKAQDFADGEEGFLPVLARRVRVIESLPFSVRGGQKQTFELKHLVESDSSKQLRHLDLRAELTANPAWHAILALPYLMEYPHECAEQVFHRYYANALGRRIVTQHPEIRTVFDRWQAAGAQALESPLSRNADLKAVMIEETPWLREADDETARRRDLALFFDGDRLDAETRRAFARLRELRNADGWWPWFAGGPRSEHISLTLVAGFGRLRQMGVDGIDLALAIDLLPELDRWVKEQDDRRRARKESETVVTLSPIDAQYLYARSFFLADVAVDTSCRPAFDRLVAQARANWTRLPRFSRAQAAVALNRLGEKQAAAEIVRSLRERAVDDPVMGMCWRGEALSWWWYQAPIESQAMMIEALLEVEGDQTSADACALWLLQQKQVQRWPSTQATADAVYALLRAGTVSLAAGVPATLEVGGEPVVPETVEAGTGYFEKRYSPAEIRPELGRVTVDNPGQGVAIGALNWQYLQEIDLLAPSADAMPLTLARRLFVRENGPRGPVLRPLAGPARVGDTVVARIELRVDRDMEYVHLKDTRAASLEPVDVLSAYRWQDGVGYFQSTRDTATHFFFDRLPRGTYVFEYACRVFQVGRCAGGFAEAQCLYAPAFNAHSGAQTLESVAAP